MQTDLSQIDDPKELKAMAYDQIGAKEQAENNLRAINQRLVQVLNAAPQLAATDAELGIENDNTEPDK